MQQTKEDYARNKAVKAGKEYKPRRKFASEEERKAARKQSVINFYLRNPEKKKLTRPSNEYLRNYKNRRYNTDPLFNLVIKMRRRLHSAIKCCNNGSMKKDKSIDLLGCSFIEYKKYIEGLFSYTMTWKLVINGSIHIDHIIPVSKFDLRCPLQQKLAFGFWNTQPLWAADNLRKGKKW